MSDSSMHISTLSDTWIHLDYLVQSGERNRSLSVIKSRGTAHSNQVHELVLSDSGVSLADIYTADGDVLMGRLRLEKENAARIANEEENITRQLKRDRLVAEEAELQERMVLLQVELASKQVEKSFLDRITENHEHAALQRRLSGLAGNTGTVEPPKASAI